MAKPSTRNMRLTVAASVVFVASMVGMSFAAVPLYKIFCQVTGTAGTTRRATVAPTPIDRMITVRFDANVANGLGWTFRPEVREVKVKLGEVGHISFVAVNRGSAAITGSAAFNVSPLDAGAYFNKIACFCFTDHTLAPGERAELPVSFFVDPKMVDDNNLSTTDTLTLSYTFYPAVNQPKPVAAAVDGANKGG